MNFIKHFVGFVNHLADDERLTPFHISLYITLFQFWNFNRFKNPIPISRGEVMRISKIGSVNTYTKCLKELDTWQYIKYESSYNPQKPSKVHLYRFDTGIDKGSDTGSDKGDEQVVRPNINSTNITNRERPVGVPHTQKPVIEFFLLKKSTETEAQKFFNHFQSNGWRVGAGRP